MMKTMYFTLTTTSTATRSARARRRRSAATLRDRTRDRSTAATRIADSYRCRRRRCRARSATARRDVARSDELREFVDLAALRRRSRWHPAAALWALLEQKPRTPSVARLRRRLEIRPFQGVLQSSSLAGARPPQSRRTHAEAVKALQDSATQKWVTHR